MKRSRNTKSGNGKWTAVGIGLIAIMLVLAYIIASGITGTWNPGKWKKDKSGGATAESANAGQMTLSDFEDNGISIAAAPMTDGISAYAENSNVYVLTATVTAASGFTGVEEVTWSVSNSALTITPLSNNPLQAELKLNRAFDWTAYVYCRYNGNTNKYGSCAAKCVSLVSSIWIPDSSIASMQPIFSCDNPTPALSVTYTPGAIKGTLMPVKAYLELSDEAYAYMKQHRLFESWESAGHGDSSLMQTSRYGINNNGACIYSPSNSDWINVSYASFVSDGSDNYFKNEKYMYAANPYLEEIFCDCAVYLDTDEQIKLVIEYKYEVNGMTFTYEAESGYVRIQSDDWYEGAFG